MNPISQQIQFFDRVYESWKAGVVHVNVKYVAICPDSSWTLLSARVELSPLELPTIINEVVATSAIRVGNILAPLSVAELDEFMDNLKQGELKILDVALGLPDKGEISIYAPGTLNEPQYFTPQLEVKGNSHVMLTQQFDYSQANAELRCGTVPFDGLVDLLSFFDFGRNGYLPQEPKILVTLHPPCDLKLDDCGLSQNKLTLRLLRRTAFAPEQISVGLRQFPNPTIARRTQIGTQVIWKAIEGGFESGTLEMELDDCSTAELMVSADNFSVRRWFLFDPHKSLNPRLTDYRYLDPDLNYLKRYLGASKESRQLEVGTAVLFHLLGATCLNPPSTETPDVIVETPNRRLALVECTIRVENIREKVSKLVHRRDGLISTENKYGLNREVMAVLVVNQPRTSIVNEEQFLNDHQVVLLTFEDIEWALANLEIPPDLDKLYLDRMNLMRNQQATLFSGLGGASGI